ncbi:MAG: class IV adenylate cyclase [Spirochaetota bacterium]
MNSTNENNFETEIKYNMPDYGENKLIKKLKELGAEDKGEIFENNLIFDNEENKMYNNDLLLRLRKTGDKNILTFKGKKIDDDTYKIREEVEIEVSDFDKLKRIFEHMGYQVKLIYQKYRRTFILKKTFITIDKLPFGNYIEIEGIKEDIDYMAGKLSLYINDDISNKNYYDIYERICNEKNIKPSPYVTFD